MNPTYVTAYPTTLSKNSTRGEKLTTSQTFVARDFAIARRSRIFFARDSATSAKNYAHGQNLTIIKTYIAANPAMLAPKSARPLNLERTPVFVARDSITSVRLATNFQNVTTKTNKTRGKCLYSRDRCQ